MGRRKGTSEAFVGPRLPISCQHCGTAFSPSSARNVAYCSRSCKTAAWAARNPERDAQLRARYDRATYVSKAKHDAHVRAHLRVAASRTRARLYEETYAPRRAALAARPCQTCGNPTNWTFGRGKLFCSVRCQRQSPAFKEANRATKAKRDAVKRGSRRAENCSPNAILTRDKWTCQRCGIGTPKTKRGTHDADAPEVDHMFPCSRNGPHQRWNLRCLCRQCNGDKGDALPSLEEAIAQMLRADAA